MWRLGIVVVSFACLLLALPAIAQTDDGGFFGLITSDHHPVPGVEVEIERVSCDCRKCPTRCGRCCPASARTTTGPDGHFAFPELMSDGVFRVNIVIPGFTSRSFTVTVPQGGLTQTFEIGGSVSESITVTAASSTSFQKPPRGTAKGVVIDAASGKPLKNTELLFVGTTRPQCLSATNETTCAWPGQTDAHGRYRITLAPGTYRVLVVTPQADVSAGTIKVVRSKVTSADVKVKDE